jgi:hypothetical protein
MDKQDKSLACVEKSCTLNTMCTKAEKRMMDSGENMFEECIVPPIFSGG